VRKINAATGIITTVAGTGSNGYSGDGGQATAAELSYPKSVCLDTSGNLYIAEYGNHCVRKVAANTGIISTLVGTGSPGYTGDNGPATNGMLRQPVSVYMSRQGNLYIAEIGNNVIRAITPAGYIFTVAGTGVIGYSGDGGPAINATFKGLTGVYVDALGYMYIADGENSVIRKVTPMVLGVEPVPAENSFAVFPNPSHGQFNISVPEVYKNGTVLMCNLMGQVVYNGALIGTQNSVAVAVPAGVYFVTIMSEAGKITQRVVIN
jgi:hypothetical protein